MATENDDGDYDDRKSEIDQLRVRILRMRGEAPERDKVIDEFLTKTRGDHSPAAWRGHVRLWDMLKSPVAEKREGNGHRKDKKPTSRLSDWF